MSTKVQNAVERLNTILPLVKRWHSLEKDNREIFSLPDAIDFAAGYFLPLLTKQAAWDPLEPA
jgi:hypothetical protein